MSLHVYAQPSPHDDAIIAGTYHDLVKLRDCINDALESESSKVQLFAGDGEGFNCHVVVRTEMEMDGVAVPYSDEAFAETRPRALAAYDSMHRYLAASK